jgi:subtilase family serine protease/Tol biopolymer transport system component/fibronectin type 3 domain-containing protein
MLMVYSLLLALPSTAHAADFTARHMGDYGNVSVMEVTGNYDANNPDGSLNAVPRQVIATEFFKIHKDEYDFLVIFSNFGFTMPESEVAAFYTGVQNDVRGIGRELFDSTSSYGSAGKLQGMIDMGNMSKVVSDPLDPRFEDTLGYLSHEMLHRWSAYVKFKDPAGSSSSALLGKNAAHWSFLLDTKGSLQYGNQWQDNKNGTFTSIATRKYYSPLDLYLMGMIDKSKVPPMLLIENPAIDPKKMPETGTTISGTSRMVTIDDIIAAEGERVPSALDSRKSFKTAFIFVTTPGTFTGQELTGIENVRNGFVTRYSILTDGKGLVQVASTPKDNLPVNGGVTQPVLIPRTLPPDINEGITWLVGRQQADGSWSDIPLTTERDTSEAVFTLQSFPSFVTHYQTGLQWLGRAMSNNTDFLARRIDSLLIAGGDASPLITTLGSLQNPDGGWGSARNFISSATDTALALKALVRAGFANRAVIGRGVTFLKSQKNGDGGWSDSGSVSAVQPTAAAIGVLSILKNEFGLDAELQSAITWLKLKQNPDGGFGSSPSTVHETALAVMALRETGAEIEITNRGVTYLLGQQSENGSWSDSPFQTALAVRSVWQATITPDLSVKSSDISFIPERVSQLPTTAVISAVIANLGRTDVQQAKVVLYDGGVTPDRKVAEQTLAFPASGSVTVTFSVPVPDGNSHTFHLAVDPDNLVKESDETNNTAVKTLSPELTYDFAVTQGDITVSSNPADIFKDVKLTARVANKGTSNGYNVQLRFFIDEPGAPFEIATIPLDIPAGGAVTKEVTWKAAKAGVDMPLTVQVDPQNTFTELSESNNRATVPLTVTGATLPNLSVSHKDIVITPNPAMERGSSAISIQVKNNGFSPAENVKVNFYFGVPGNGGVLIGSETIPALSAGQSQQVAVTWGPIAESGVRIIFISVDPDNTVAEIAEDDNSAFTQVEIRSLPDLAISASSIALNPSAPKEGDTLAINVTVQNSGSQDALNVPVLVKEGATVIGTQVIAQIAGHGQAIASIPYSTTGKSGSHEIQVSVDAGNLIAELSEDNNTATKTFSVQNANLWVSEQYISPNGDGVKDTTDFFFRLAASTKVQVQVVNRKGEVVRTFTGGELDNTAGTTVTWDGRGDIGTIVNDGEYQLKVVGASGAVLGSLPVTVDNNRSPLTDAIGTKYLLNTNLTCNFPFIYLWKWLPDESGLIASVHYYSFDKQMPEYPSGLYAIGVNGNDIVRLIPQEWNFGSKDSLYDYEVNYYSLSPDGGKVAFFQSKVVRATGVTEETQLWVVDRDGGNLTLLDFGDAQSNRYLMNGEWTPDGKRIAYSVRSYDNWDAEIFLLDVAGRQKISIVPKQDKKYTNLTWAADGNRFYYIGYGNDSNGNYYETLNVSTVTGNKQEIFRVNGTILNSHWRDNGEIFLTTGTDTEEALWLIDTTGAGNHRKKSGVYAPSLSPDLKLFFGRTNAETGFFDEEGNAVYLLPEDLKFPSYNDSCGLQAHTIRWSSDGKKVALLNGCWDVETGRIIPVPGEKNLLAIDLGSRSDKSYESPFLSSLIGWMSDNATIAGYKARGITNLYAFNTLTGSTILFRENAANVYGNYDYISPHERYLANYKYFDAACCGEKYRDFLWATSSLLNLTADLRLARNKSAVVMSGTAADLNFGGFRVEYADIKTPDQWNQVIPSTDTPVSNGALGIWVPPCEGTFYVRLTVWDKAGNSKTDRKRISWGLSSSITNIYKTQESFSPNSDGVKDTVDIRYRVVEPAHLEFFVYDENDQLIKSISKEHAVSEDGGITWNGTDESGRVVPDGKYRIRVFDHDFFVDVDNTLPDTKITLGPSQFLNHKNITAKLRGHAVDNNFKNWIVEYGYGDNPQEWRAYRRGEDILVEKDEEGNPLLNPVIDAEISEFSGKTGFPRNMKYRITAEDAAGNKSSSVSGFLEEGIFLFSDYILLPNVNKAVPDDLSQAGPHRLFRFVTIRNNLTKLTLQYRIGNQWVDNVDLADPDMTETEFNWINSNFNSKLVAMRLRGVDASGREYFSNELSLASSFKLFSNCNAPLLSTYIAVNDNLTELKMQFKGINDTAWTDYRTYSSPEELLAINMLAYFNPEPPSVDYGKKYLVKMQGKGSNGAVYESVPVPFPSECPVVITTAIDSGIAACGGFSNAVSISTEVKPYEVNAVLKTLQYYIQKPDGMQLLRSMDLLQGQGMSMDLETASMPEGRYTIQSVLGYLDLSANVLKEATSTATLTVDRKLPASQITFPPGNSTTVCPIKMVEGPHDWFGIPIEGLATDNTGVKSYRLFYGVGDAPTVWLPAVTWKKVKGEWASVQIEGVGVVKGRIGTWDITDLRGNDYALKLEVTDIAGNTYCHISRASINHPVRISSFTADKALFSPNGNGAYDDVSAGYLIDEPARVDVNIYALISGYTYGLSDVPVRTITSGLQHVSGDEALRWDGLNDRSEVVADGIYGIAVHAANSCGNITRDMRVVAVDNTSPTVVIAYPKPMDPLPPGNIIEVKGKVDDAHLKFYRLEVGEGADPDSWRTVSLETHPVGRTPQEKNILGRWDTTGLLGKWTLRLTAQDSVGNSAAITSTIDLGERKTLVKDVTALPLLFSPNNDGKIDSCKIAYEVVESSQVTIEILDGNAAVVRNLQSSSQPPGRYSLYWDGGNGSGERVPDGEYRIKLAGALTSNPLVTQTEMITVSVDTTPPSVNFSKPVTNAYLNISEIAVTGTLKDLNLSQYTIQYSGPDGAYPLDSGNQSRESHTFGLISPLKEGSYTLSVDARDQAENPTKLTQVFTIDRTAPNISLETPKAGEYFGNTKNVIVLNGLVTEKNLERLVVRYGSGDAPGQWIELNGMDSIPSTPDIFSWKVGKTDGVVDGVYTVSLYAKDKAGLEGEAKAKITIDNTPPEVMITSLKENGYAKAPLDIKGTVNDNNLDKAALEISEGKCAAAFKWVPVSSITASVKDGLLKAFTMLPSDGDYCFRLSATDKSGNKSELKVSVILDSTPPAAPRLSGKVSNRADVELVWTENNETDLAGYNVYRNQLKLNPSPVSEVSYKDQSLKEGIYSYVVKAVDFAGNESEPSNALKFAVDTTGPSVRISSPSEGSRVGSMVDIRGTAFSTDDFKEYRVSIGRGAVPSSWSVIRTSPVPVSYGSLVEWDTISMADGETYAMKLEGEDLSGNISTSRVSVIIDNTAPAKPVLLTAAPSGVDVTLAWRANSEADFAGYLLFRNNQLANVPGGVVGSLKPYLLSGTSYADKNLPDGKHAYYLIAMDQAGNTSDQSNTIEVELENRRPHAVISEPADGSRLEQKTLVRAESPDTDIVSVQFQYRKVGDTAWSGLGSPVTGSSFVTYFDPKTLGLTYGDYQLMATASDKAGADPSPTPVTVTYTDLTTTAPPAGLKAQTSGKTVTLSWTANTEADLDGYTVYRSIGTDRTKVNASLLKTLSYLDENLADNDYTYEITATDTHGNESASSGVATARVYAPVLLQPYTPLGQPNLKIEGKNAVANASVELMLDNASGRTSAGKVAADPQGVFALENMGLVLGENRISATATDAANNVSRTSDSVVVVYNETPSAPVNLVGDALDHTVNLRWDATNTDPEVSGYNVFRDGVKLNLPGAASGGTAAASSSMMNWSTYPYKSYSPSLALDGDSTTAWRSEAQAGGDKWWEVVLPQPELINHLEIHWGTETDGTGKDIVYGGKDFEVRAWSGYAWIPLTKVSGNNGRDNGFDYKPSYRTDRIRIYVTAAMSGHLRISEVGILKDNLVATTSYQDIDAKDKKYGYKVTAVDKYGFESPPSEEKSVVVGDIIPPAAPRGLSAAASGPDVTLDWSLTPNTEPDLAGYLVYRNSEQGWMRITPTPVSALSYLDALLPNGSYTYRITAVDTVGNESGPSNEATAAVSIGLQVAPVITQAASLPRGDITVAWTCAASSIAGYSIFRSATSGGPYTKLNTQLLAGTSYLDAGVISGKTYYYVVRVVDSLGNESPNSSEASAVSLDSEAPNKPAIVSPTMPGIALTLRRGAVDVSGTADANTTVELYQNDVSVGKAGVAEPRVVKNISLNVASYDASLSPDGTTLLYSDSNEIWLLTLATGRSDRVVAQGLYPNWFADGKRFGYLSFDDNNSYRVGIYDVSTNTSQFATNDDDPYEDYPSWSTEGDKVAFQREIDGVSSLWIKDFVSGELSQVPSNSATFSLSPDGSRLAYFDNLSLSVLDLVKGTVIPVSDATDGISLSWSPDNRKLSYVSLQDSRYDIGVFDSVAQTATRITDSSTSKFSPVWSPDGSRVAFGQENTDGRYSLQAANLQGTIKVLADTIVELHDIQWMEPGSLVYIDRNYLNSISLQPQFRFSDVTLESGANRMYVTSADSAGNISPPSDEITVVYDTSKQPDISISSRDILIYPTNPKPGTEVLVKAIVRNPSAVDVENAAVELHLWDLAGELKLLKSDVITHLGAGSEGSVEVRFTAGSMAGSNTIIAVVDPKDVVKELSESNNNATAEFYVTDKEEILMTTVVAQSRYSSGRDVVIGVDLRNTGAAAEGKLDVLVEDEAGAKVAQVESKDIALAYGAKQTLNYTWNTGATFAGTYRIHSVFKGTTGILAENRTPFAIVADQTLDARVTTDKAVYRPRENVLVTAQVKNTSANNIIQKLVVKTKIVDSLNQELYGDSREVLNLLPGADTSLSTPWNSGLTVPGSYRAQIQVYLGDSLFTTTETAFTITADGGISGAITVEPAVVAIGNSFKAVATITNNGNAETSGSLKVSLTDPESREILETYEEPFALPVNTSHSGEFTYQTGALALKTYVVTLQQKTGETLATLANTSVTIQDVTPPTVILLSPEQGSIHHGTIKVQALVYDDASGVDRTEYRVDTGVWKLLPATEASRGKYMVAWEPSSADSGAHTISCRAYDKKGNESSSVSVTFTVQLDTTPPVLKVSTLSNGARTNQEALNITGTVQDDTGVREVSVNGEYITVNADGSFTHAIILVEGENRITTLAYDLAGNRSEDTRIITLDLNAPNLVVTQPSDNLRTGEQLVTVSGAVDENCTVDVRLNGASAFTGIFDSGFSTTVLLLTGLNHIETTATDVAGNTSSIKRTVFYDNEKPTLVITEPGQDISTNQSSITIRGNVGDNAAIPSVTMTFDGTMYTPAVVNGVFQQVISFTQEKLYEIIITATDGIVGHEVSTQRNIIYDTTKPVLTIDPVLSPVADTSQVVTGTREERALVTVSCPTATVGEISYSTATTWSVSLTNLKAGANAITATSSDAAGNQATASASITVQVDDNDLVLIPFPSILWPPNHKKVPVLIAGWIRHPCHSDIESVVISVGDEYGKYNYTNLHFGSVIMLEAWREGNDKDGRIYTVTAVATHRDGRKTTTVRRVIVPHNLSKCDHEWDLH